MVGNARIIELRALLAEKFPANQTKAGAHLATGIPALDERLDGGIPKARITEIFEASRGAGGGLVLAAMLAQARRENQHLGLIDGSDVFDPQPLDDKLLRHLLWVRCQSAAQAIKAADLLLRDGNLPMVALDLRGNAEAQLRKIPSTTWYRFQRIAEQGTTALAVLTPRAMVNSAEMRIRVDGRFGLDDLEKEFNQLVAKLEFEVVRTQSFARRQEEAV